MHQGYMALNRTTQEQQAFLSLVTILISLLLALLLSNGFGAKKNDTKDRQSNKKSDKQARFDPKQDKEADIKADSYDEVPEDSAEPIADDPSDPYDGVSVAGNTDVTDDSFMRELEEFAKETSNIAKTKISNAKSRRVNPSWLKLIHNDLQNTRLVARLFKHILLTQNEETFIRTSTENKKQVVNEFISNFAIENSKATMDNIMADMYCTFQLLAPHDTDLKYSFQTVKVLSKFISNQNEGELRWLDARLLEFHKQKDVTGVTDADITDICNVQRFAAETMKLSDVQDAMEAVKLDRCSLMVHKLYKHIFDFFKHTWTTSTRATAFPEAKKDLSLIIKALEKDNLKPLFVICISIILGNLRTSMRFATLSNFISVFRNSIFYEYRLCSDFARVIQNYVRDIRADRKIEMFDWRLNESDDLITMGPRIFHYVRPHLCSSSKHHVGLSYIDNGNIQSDSFKPDFTGFVQGFPEADSNLDFQTIVNRIYMSQRNSAQFRSLRYQALYNKMDVARTTACLVAYCCCCMLGVEGLEMEQTTQEDDEDEDSDDSSKAFEVHLYDTVLKQRIHFNLYHSPIFWLDKKRIDAFLMKRNWRIVLNLKSDLDEQIFKSKTVMVRRVKEFHSMLMDKRSLWAEQKYDGFRLQLHAKRDERVKGHLCQFYTKNGYDQTERYKLLVALCVDYLVQNNPDLQECILDGELVVYDIKSKNYSAWGKENLTASQEKKAANFIILNSSLYKKDRLPGSFGSDLLDSDFDGKEPPMFEISAEAFSRFIKKSKANTAIYLQNYQLCFVAFDILLYNGRGLLEVPFSRRRRILESIVNPGVEGRLEISTGRDCQNMHDLHDFLKRIAMMNGEGIILKRYYHPYTPAKKIDWQKIKFLSTDYDTAPVAGGFRVTSNVFNMFHIVCAMPSTEMGVSTWKTMASCFGFMNASADAAKHKARILTHETFELLSNVHRELITKTHHTRFTDNYEITYSKTNEGYLLAQYVHKDDASRTVNVKHVFNAASFDVQFICHPCACDDGVISIIGDYRVGSFKEAGGRINQTSPYTSDVCVRFPAGRFRDKTDKTWKECDTLEKLRVDIKSEDALRNSSVSSIRKTAYSGDFRDLARLFRMYRYHEKFMEYRDIEHIDDSFNLDELLHNIENDTKVVYPYTAKRIFLNDIKDRSKNIVKTSIQRKTELITKILSIVLPDLDLSTDSGISLMERYKKLFLGRKSEENSDNNTDEDEEDTYND